MPSTVRHWRRVTKIFPEGIIPLDKEEEDITKEQNTHSVTPSSLSQENKVSLGTERATEIRTFGSEDKRTMMVN